MPDIETEVVNTVKKEWDLANIKGAYIYRTEEFIRGKIYFVSIIDANDVEHDNFVYVVGKKVRVFSDMHELVLGIGAARGGSDILKMIFEVTGVSGLVAVMITATICWGALAKVTFDSEISKALTASLSLILGFYFGSIHRTPPKSD